MLHAPLSGCSRCFGPQNPSAARRTPGRFAMKKAALRLTCLAAGCASLFAIAAPDLTVITQATATINDCAAITNAIAAIPTPPDHAKAIQASASNDASTDPKQKVAIDPVHAAFREQMKSGEAKFDACGKNVRAAEAKVNDFVRALAAQKLGQDDANAVKAAYDAYTKAVENMRA